MSERRLRADRRPLYARLLDLRNIQPGGVMCFVLFEGSALLAVLLAMAELVSWWGVLVLPAVVAAMVKINDLVAGPARRGEPAPVVGQVRVGGQAQLQEAATLPGLSGDGAIAVTHAEDTAIPRRGGPVLPASQESRSAAHRADDRPARAPYEPENVRAARRSDARRFDD